MVSGGQPLFVLVNQVHLRVRSDFQGRVYKQGFSFADSTLVTWFSPLCNQSQSNQNHTGKSKHSVSNVE